MSHGNSTWLIILLLLLPRMRDPHVTVDFRARVHDRHSFSGPDFFWSRTSKETTARRNEDQSCKKKID